MDAGKLAVIIGVIITFSFFCGTQILALMKKEKKTKTNSTIVKICFVSVLLLWFSIPITTHLYNKHNLRKELFAKKIYEIENAFTYIMVYNSLQAVFMICEPPSTNEELHKIILEYINNNNIVLSIKNRMPEIQCDEIWLVFTKPSKEFPVGWIGGVKSNFFGVRITDYAIVDVYIPWNSISNSDFRIIFHSE